ncbi:MAG: 4-hydroxy-3-methylbut-2-enyl diphosphate reductase [Elusimicrobiota bacterium]
MQAEKNNRVCNVIKSQYCGFCSGVTIALRKAEAAASDYPVYTMGPIIHNPQVVENLRKNNIIDITSKGGAEDTNEGDSILIRSHGIPYEEELHLKNLNLNIIDATCPKVKKAQKIFSKLAHKYDRVFIVGKKTHPEVKGIISRAPGKGFVLSGPEEAGKISPGRNAGVLVQTTYRRELFFKTVFELLKKFNVVEAHNTICEETINRQKELKILAQKVDIIFIIGGKNSSNTKRLFELSKELIESYHVETPDEVLPEYIKGKQNIGIATGASTPMEIVEEIENKIKNLI